MLPQQNKARRRSFHAILLLGLLFLSVGMPSVGASADDGDGKADVPPANGEAVTQTGEGESETKTPEDTAQQQQQCEGGDETCKVRIVTVEELATKKGDDGGKELWLSILGQVYDVSAGPEYYAPGAGYSIFAGQDATVPFITGNFTEEEAKKHTDELTAAQLYALDQEWGKFYAKEERYHFVGFLCCRYYDKDGQPTEETLRVAERVKSYAKIKEAKDKERREKRRQMMMTMTAKQATTTPATQAM